MEKEPGLGISSLLSQIFGEASGSVTLDSAGGSLPSDSLLPPLLKTFSGFHDSEGADDGLLKPRRLLWETEHVKVCVNTLVLEGCDYCALTY